MLASTVGLAVGFPVAFAMLEAVEDAVGFVVGGAITGGVLGWLLRQPLPKAQRQFHVTALEAWMREPWYRRLFGSPPTNR